MTKAHLTKAKPPKWFCQENYKKNTEKADPKFWLSAILSRTQLMTELEELESVESTEDTAAKRLILLERLANLATLQKSGNNTQSTVSSVTHPTLGAFNDIWEAINANPEYKTLCNSGDLEASAFFSLYEKPINELFPDQQPPSHDSHILAQIDMNFSDAKIKEDFEAWLGRYRRSRKANKAPQTITATDLRHWHELMVLPYIDLALWQDLIAGEPNNKRWASADYEEALFLNSSQDKIRKTIHPKAKELFSLATIRNLMLMTNP